MCVCVCVCIYIYVYICIYSNPVNKSIRIEQVTKIICLNKTLCYKC